MVSRHLDSTNNSSIEHHFDFPRANLHPTIAVVPAWRLRRGQVRDDRRSREGSHDSLPLRQRTGKLGPFITLTVRTG